MKSLHSDQFNHDNWASDYDQNVLNEENPIRAGYESLLEWVINESQITKGSVVLELGSGTGNLTKRIKECERIICVDISAEMEAVAVSKTNHLKNREFIKSDILEVFEKDIGTFDAVISTYTIHHLVAHEKSELFKCIKRVLNKDGVAVFGDLMFQNESTKKEIVQRYSDASQENIVEDIEEEFFWDVDHSIQDLESLEFETETKRFSTLSFGITAKLSANRVVQGVNSLGPHTT